ncbi:LuxR C-terminal-related transcriptional regulator [Actinomycetaceae bacterium MB13-C1-2]|nr:LuxR C-terminal-related transcriptional regulator [Actinomycetaceae bacterium MB13-C1-2]
MAPLTVVEGLPGSGKSTLAVQWMNQLPPRIRREWVDATTVRTSEQVAAALERLAPTTPEKEVVVAIDDFVVPSDEGFVSLLSKTLNAHAGLYLLLCTEPGSLSRQWNQLGTAEMQLIDQNALAAEQEEMVPLAAHWGYSVRSDLLSSLRSEFNGWLAPIRWALDHKDTNISGGFVETKRRTHLQVLDSISDPDTRQGFSICAAAGEVTEDLLETLFTLYPGQKKSSARGSAASILRTLTSSGLMQRTELIGTTPVFRVVSPLREVFSEDLDTDAGVPFHREIVRYYVNSGTPPALASTVCCHARAAGAWGTLETLWDQHGASLFSTYGTDLSIYAQLPANALAKHPKLWAISMLADSILEPQTSVGTRTSITSSLATRSKVDPDLFLAIGAVSVRDLRRSGDAPGAMKVARERYGRYVNVRRETHAREALMFLAWFEVEWAFAAMSDRNRNTALQLFERALVHAQLSRMNYLIAFVAARTALHNQVTGHSRESDRLLRVVDDLGSVATLPGVRANCQLTRAMKRIEDLDASGAAQALSALDDLEDSWEQWPLVTLANTQYALLFGSPSAALKEIERARALFSDQLPFSRRNRTVLARCAADLLMSVGELHGAELAIESITDRAPEMDVPKVRLALLRGDTSEARALASNSVWSASPNARDVAELTLMEAVAALEEGDDEEAGKLYSRACSLLEDVASRAILLTVPDDLRRRLEVLAGEDDIQPITRPDSARKEVYPRREAMVALTTREGEVLRAMSEHKTLVEVADSLSVSPNTVKKQSVSIYRKLGVHSRGEAVAAARRLGLMGGA